MKIATDAAPASLTPFGLAFDEPTHRYTYNGRPVVSVTGALEVVGFIDTEWFTPEDAARGTRVHAAIHMLNAGELRDEHLDGEILPYVRAYQLFLAESAYRVDASEERVCDPAIHCAGTLDLRGQFVEQLDDQRIDVIDVKSGAVPSWVGYQTAGYVRLLPAHLRRFCRRWTLELRADGKFTLLPLTKRSDLDIFLAAVTIAQAKRGWL